VNAFQTIQLPQQTNSIPSPTALASTPPLLSQPPPENNNNNNDNNNNNNNEEEEEEPPALILDGVQEQMASLKSKYPTAEADYLAAARKRAEQRAESVNTMSSDRDWKEASDEKKQQFGTAADDNDWEASAKEAGNEDSQILIPVDMSASGDGDEDEEPRLLL
jgi:hypothetical protein